MIKVIGNYFENAQLAMAAYAELNSNMGDEAYRLALEGAEMSFSQAEAFAATYEIIDQYTCQLHKSSTRACFRSMKSGIFGTKRRVA